MNLLEQMGIRFPLKEKDFASHVLSPKKSIVAPQKPAGAQLLLW